MATILALRVSGRGEGVEQCPVGLAGIEQRPDSVVGEVGEPERGPFDAFDEIVGVVSGGREPPPPALLEPYVTVSRHTAPTVRRGVEARRCQ